MTNETGDKTEGGMPEVPQWVPYQHATGPRRAVQIAVAAASLNSPGMVYALADDGTIWGMTNYFNDLWTRLPPIPQGETP